MRCYRIRKKWHFPFFVISIFDRNFEWSGLHNNLKLNAQPQCLFSNLSFDFPPHFNLSFNWTPWLLRRCAALNCWGRLSCSLVASGTLEFNFPDLKKIFFAAALLFTCFILHFKNPSITRWTFLQRRSWCGNKSMRFSV